MSYLNLGMTPHFTILVWGSSSPKLDEMYQRMGWPRLPCEPICMIEVDTTVPGDLTISRHKGLKLIPQKMLTQHAN